jgi:hypothetical protein
VLYVLAAGALAQPAPAARAQIDRLIAAVEGSGCAMERNGALHDAHEAAAHLRMKLARAGAQVTTVEQFIDRVASTSSFSGAPYRVHCPGTAGRPAAEWLRAQLRVLQQSE